MGKFNSRKIEGVVKKSVKTVRIREGGKEICPESEEMAEFVPVNLQKKAGKCTSMETEDVSKTNNALINAE